MRKCPYCHSDLEDNARYCYFCMHDLEPKKYIKSKSHLSNKLIIVLLSILLTAVFLATTFLTVKFLIPKLKKEFNGFSSFGSVAVYSDTTESNSNINPDKPNQSFDDKDYPKRDDNDNVDSDYSSSETQTSSDETPSDDNNNNNNNNDNSNDLSNTECTHNWQEITQIINHPEEGHYETVQKERKIKYYKCAVCYQKHKTLDEYYTHFDSSHTTSLNINIFRDRYETVDEWEYYDDKVWVVDKKAYDETVVIGYKCTLCDQTKTSKN